MAFDIDKMKADGVSPHLIEIAELSERSDTAAFEKIAMGIENTEIFRQFISMESDAPVWDYMYAAGLCTKAEADWFKSGGNPYIEGGSDTTYSFRVEEYIGVSGLHIGDEFDATRIIEPPECDDGQIPWVYITENLGFPYNSTQTLTQEMTATAKDGIIDVTVGCKAN